MENEELKGGGKEDLNNKNSINEDIKEGEMVKRKICKKTKSGKCKKTPKYKISKSYKKKRK